MGLRFIVGAFCRSLVRAHRRPNDEAASYSIARAEQVRLSEACTAACDAMLKKLLGLPLEETLTIDEYREAKAEVLAEKQRIAEPLTASESGEAVWFERRSRFGKPLREANLRKSTRG